MEMEKPALPSRSRTSHRIPILELLPFGEYGKCLCLPQKEQGS